MGPHALIALRGGLSMVLGCAEPVTAPDGWPGSGCTRGGEVQDVSRSSLRLERDVALAMEVWRPEGQGCWAGLVMVPPGLDEGLTEEPRVAAETLTAEGVVVVLFDPRGRGSSAGVEDVGGPIHQADLAAILRWVAAEPDVDPERVVLLSRSMGNVMAAGALARYPSLEVRAWADLEGPGRLPEDLEHVSDRSRERLEALSEGEDWWEERSPVESIGSFDGHYRRIQAQDDHATGAWMGHAQILLGTASEGEASEVDLNGVSHSPWTYEAVEEAALDGRTKLDDERALELIRSLL